MFTDMVGYTALGQWNELLSLAMVEEQRKLIRPILSKHGGREVKTIGDAFLVEFPNAVDAVRCAYDIQRAIREFNLSLAIDKRIHLRIGLHVGEVIRSQGDISGDAVNIASRIEPLAEDGGVCLTRQVYDHVKNKVDLNLQSIGPKSFKNVAEPIEIYKMAMPWGKVGEAPVPQFDMRRIAILPFANMSPDPNDEYFADGMTEELISTMSRIGELTVISRTSVMQYKEKRKPMGDIRNELQAGTILEGSIRKASNKVRISVQIIDANLDKHLWAESYDRELQDIFGIQSEIAERVADALKVKLLTSEKKDIERRPTENLETYQLYLKGRYYVNTQKKEDSVKALERFWRALELDPKCAVAYAGISDCYHFGSHYNWYSPEEAFPAMKKSAMKAIEIDPRLPEAHASLGAVYFHYEWKWNEANGEFQLAERLKPSYALVYEMHSYLLAVMGKSEESAKLARRGKGLAHEYVTTWLVAGIWVGGATLRGWDTRRSIDGLTRLTESYPDMPSPHDCLGFAYFRESRFAEAISEIRRATGLSKGDSAYMCDLALMYALTGEKDAARTVLKDLLDVSKISYVSDVQLACVQYHLGMHDEAFINLERAFGRRAIDLPDIISIPEMSDLRSDPRWVSIETRMGLRDLGP
jgi:TolB-like protein/Tfp pilus assembly protein PilF